jgi:hypothetical protein
MVDLAVRIVDQNGLVEAFLIRADPVAGIDQPLV